MPIDDNEKSWLVAHVRLFHEKKCVERLQKLNIETYLPIRSELHYWKDRKKRVDRVLTPQMVFVHVTTDERITVLEDRSVTHFYAFPGSGKATVVPDSQMKSFMFLVGNADSEVEFTSESLKKGDKVKVLRGPLANLEAEYVRVGNKSKVAIRVNDLGCALVEIPLTWIEKLD